MKINNKELELTPIRNFNDPFGKWCKVYNDGNHFVATRTTHNDRKTIVRDKDVTDEDLLFNELYLTACKNHIVRKPLYEFMKDNISEKYPEMENLDEYVDTHIKMKLHNFYTRVKRFRRKAYLNKWNKFVTITYDDKLHTPESFRKKLRKCLSNLHCRHGWTYMGVFEHAPGTDRLHFHAIMHIPEGQMIGEMEEKNDYSTAQKKMQKTMSNTFFAKTFGRNDFKDMTEEDLKYGHAIEYLLKYLSKTNEKIVYSRGIPTEMNMYVENRDIVTEYEDYVMKYVLFDDCVRNGKYLPYGQRRYEQTTLFATT